MKGFLVLLVLVVAGAVAYPLVNEDVSSPCKAVERRAIASVTPGPGAGPGARRGEDAMTRAFISSIVGGLSDGAIAAAVVKQQHPNLPAVVGCTVAYWRMVIDPSSVETMMRQAAMPR